MGEVIVVTSGKGGVGKTTACANIGAALSLLNKKTVLIDTDMGLRNLDIIMGLESSVVYDIVDVIGDDCNVSKAMIKDNRFNSLYFIAASQTKGKDALTGEQMKKFCGILKNYYDYIIIDCPAGIEHGFKTAISGADRAIVIATPDVASLRDADRVIGILEENGISDSHLLINRIRPELVKSGDMLNIDDIIDMLGINLIGAIADDNDIIISSNRGEICSLKQDSNCAKAFVNIARRITGEYIPLSDVGTKKRNFFKKKLFKIKNKGISL